jgi:hypothetical protein
LLTRPSEHVVAGPPAWFREGAKAQGHGAPRFHFPRPIHFTRHDRFLESLGPTRQFRELMASARERYQRFTDDGTPTRVDLPTVRSTFS